MYFYLLLLSLLGSSILTYASPIPFSEEKLLEIDRLRAQGMSEVGFILSSEEVFFCFPYIDIAFQ